MSANEKHDEEPIEEEELTEEEKALDKEYQEACRVHTSQIFVEVAKALNTYRDEPLVVVEKVTTVASKYSAPSFLRMLVGWLSAGAGPVDPLAHKRVRTDYWSELVSGLSNSATQVAAAMLATKATETATHQPAPSPSSVWPPTPPPPAQQQQQQQQQQQPVAEANPLDGLVQMINQAVAAKEKPRRVAGKIAAVVHAAQEFEQMEKNMGPQKLLEDPEGFLKRAYPMADKAYLEEIAKSLVEMFPHESASEEPGERP